MSSMVNCVLGGDGGGSMNSLKLKQFNSKSIKYIWIQSILYVGEGSDSLSGWKIQDSIAKILNIQK